MKKLILKWKNRRFMKKTVDYAKECEKQATELDLLQAGLLRGLGLK